VKHTPLVICDLEATCWDLPTGREEMEIIEIGAVRLEGGEIVDEFHQMVRPVVHPQLSEFCKTLTTIQQHEVDGAEPFPTVYPAFQSWLRAGEGSFVFSSWGQYDLNQLQLDVRRHNLPWMSKLSNHLNLKHLFAEHRRVKPCGMERALQLVNLPLEGTHHRGLDDARNIARLAQWMLPQLLQTQPLLTPE
jgi:3'-5' exoribonuclease 1